MTSRKVEDWFNITWIYSNPTFAERKYLWDSVKKFQKCPKFPWLCCGDFNELAAASEKQSQRPIERRRVDLFREFLDDTGLMDLEFNGCKFTWLSNQREGLITKEKIDMGNSILYSQISL